MSYNDFIIAFADLVEIYKKQHPTWSPDKIYEEMSDLLSEAIGEVFED